MAYLTNTQKWLIDNQRFFLPPVCNKMLHGDGQLKVFYVGGPNVRKDFHIEEGEELFFQRKGDINLVTLQQREFRNVKIKEGEIFLLPGRIPHSPQRYEGTIGMVIERERIAGQEMDCLRYYIGDTIAPLWERWFFCSDLGAQLGPVIQEYFSSKAHSVGQPGVDSFLCTPHFPADNTHETEDPITLRTWLDKNRSEIDSEGQMRMFDTSYQTDVICLGEGKHKLFNPRAEIFIWQLEGDATVDVGGNVITLKKDTTLLVEKGSAYSSKRAQGGVTLCVIMDPKHRSHVFAN